MKVIHACLETIIAIVVFTITERRVLISVIVKTPTIWLPLSFLTVVQSSPPHTF